MLVLFTHAIPPTITLRDQMNTIDLDVFQAQVIFKVYLLAKDVVKWQLNLPQGAT
jgi:hypothetical protein